jgi:NAD(P)H-quinone oxidoreductase subunit 2
LKQLGFFLEWMQLLIHYLASKNKNFIINSTIIFLKAFHLVLSDESFIFPKRILISGLFFFVMIDSTFDKIDMH